MGGDGDGDGDAPRAAGKAHVQMFRVQDDTDAVDGERLVICKERFGEFFPGDSYIILHFSQEETSGSASKTNREATLYIWVGRDSTVLTTDDAYDSHMVQALLLSCKDIEPPVDISALNSYAVVPQGKEPPQFCAMFDSSDASTAMIIHGTGARSGQCASAADRTTPFDNNKCLYHVRTFSQIVEKDGGKIAAYGVQVPKMASSINSQDCFFIYMDGIAFLWLGKQSSDAHCDAAAVLAGKIAGDAYAVLKMHEGEEMDEFWTELGGKTDYAPNRPPRNSEDPVLLQLRADEDVTCDKIGTDFAQEDLAEGAMMILDDSRGATGQVFFWVGSEVEADEDDPHFTKRAKVLVSTLSSSRSNESGDLVSVMVRSGSEPEAFTYFFPKWDPSICKRGKDQEADSAIDDSTNRAVTPNSDLEQVEHDREPTDEADCVSQEEEKPDDEEHAEKQPREEVEGLRVEDEKAAATKADEESLAKQREEDEKNAAEKAEEERLAKMKEEEEEREKAAAEEARLEQERREEEKRVAAEKAEEERLAILREEEEERKRAAAEEARLEQERREEEERVTAEKAEEERVAKLREKEEERERAAAEEARLEQERREEEERVEEERLAKLREEEEERERAAAEEARLEQEQREEEERIAAEKAEEERLAKLREEEEERERAAAEEAKLEQERREEEERVEEERLAKLREEEEERERAAAEEARLEQERREEEERIAAEKAEEERLAKLKEEEEERERAAAEEARLEQEQREEEERIAAENAEEERLAKLKEEEERERAAAEEAKLEQERREEEERVAAEKAEEERLAKLRKEEEERERAMAEEARLEQERREEEERVAAEKAEEGRLAKLREEEEEQERAAAEEARLEQERREEEERIAAAKAEEEAEEEDGENITAENAEEGNLATLKKEETNGGSDPTDGDVKGKAAKVIENTETSEKITTFHSLEELTKGVDGVPWASREKHLSDEDFENVFSMSKDDFYELAMWKRVVWKKKVGLF